MRVGKIVPGFTGILFALSLSGLSDAAMQATHQQPQLQQRRAEAHDIETAHYACPPSWANAEPIPYSLSHPCEGRVSQNSLSADLIGNQPRGLGPAFHIGGAPVYGPAPGEQEELAAASGGTSFMVVWHDQRTYGWDIYGARVSASGALLDRGGIAISTAADDQRFPAIASDGTDYMVVWDDHRTRSYHIYGARIDSFGTVLDPDGIPISTTSSLQAFPAIAFDGTNYMVVWQDSRTGSSIYGSRVSPSGDVLDPDGIRICTADGDQKYPAIVCGGANCLVVWQDERGGSWDVYGARIDLSGAVLDPDGMPIATGSRWQQSPAMTFDGRNYFVVWENSAPGFADVIGTRIDLSGNVLDPGGVRIADTESWHPSPALAFDGTGYMVTWQDGRPPMERIYAARVDTFGAVVSPAPLPISALQNRPATPVIAFNGTNHLVTCQVTNCGSSEVSGVRVDPSGTVIDEEEIEISGSTTWQDHPAAAFDGTNYMVVWHDEHCKTTDIYGARVDPSGTVMDPARAAISVADGDQRSPAIAFDGTNYMVVWWDSRGNSHDIYGARVASTGAVLDPEGIPISTAAGDQWFPAIAFDGTNYLVAWHDERSGSSDIYGARVDASGAVLDPEGIAISTRSATEGFPAIAFDGSNYMVTWHAGGSYSYDVYAARVDPSGVVLDPDGIAISTELDSQVNAAIAFDGTNYMIVWQYFSRSTYGIYAARVDPSGIVLDHDAVPISAGENWQGVPAVAFNGKSYVVTWLGHSGGSYDIYGALVDASGTLIYSDGVSISDEPHNQDVPAVASGDLGQVLVAYPSFISESGYGSDRICGNLWTPPAYEPTVQLALAPNPFRDFVRMRYNLPGDARVRLAVYDVMGRAVKTIAHGYREPGWHYETWDGKDAEGRLMPSGIYFVRIQCKHGRTSLKCILVR